MTALSHRVLALAQRAASSLIVATKSWTEAGTEPGIDYKGANCMLNMLEGAIWVILGIFKV